MFKRKMAFRKYKKQAPPFLWWSITTDQTNKNVRCQLSNESLLKGGIFPLTLLT